MNYLAAHPDLLTGIWIGGCVTLIAAGFALVGGYRWLAGTALKPRPKRASSRGLPHEQVPDGS